MPVTREVLWSATLGATPLPDRIDAAAANGYTELSLSAGDGTFAAESGIEPEEWKRRAADVGVGLSILDGLVEWHPHLPPKRPLGPPMSVDDVLATAEGFGVELLNVLAPYKIELSIEGLAEHFAALCDRAADAGLRVHIEFTPKSPVPDIVTAWELVRLADRPNGGILFDTWHFYRTNPDFDALAQVPGDRIFSVQLSDGATEFVEGLLPDTFRHRRVPGEGDFDLVRALRALDAIGGLRLCGPEVLSMELFALPPVEAAQRVADGFDRVAAEAFPVPAA